MFKIKCMYTCNNTITEDYNLDVGYKTRHEKPKKAEESTNENGAPTG